MPHDAIEAELLQSFAEKDYAHSYAEDFFNAAIATQIKVLREDRELTQAQLAELAGMKQSRISTLEDINYGSWNLKTLRRLAAAFDVALTVSFESFSKVIGDVSSFSRDRLRRPSRLDDLQSMAAARRRERTLDIVLSSRTEPTRLSGTQSVPTQSAATALGDRQYQYSSSALEGGIHDELGPHSTAAWSHGLSRSHISALGSLQ